MQWSSCPYNQSQVEHHGSLYRFYRMEILSEITSSWVDMVKHE